MVDESSCESGFTTGLGVLLVKIVRGVELEFISGDDFFKTLTYEVRSAKGREALAEVDSFIGYGVHGHLCEDVDGADSLVSIGRLDFEGHGSLSVHAQGHQSVS